MLCVKPILLTHLDKKKFPEGLLVACGSCIVCRKQRAREWALRLDHEKDYAEYRYFVTLTYAPEYVPKCYSVVKKDLQRYIKRLRKNTGSVIKYYACGEYGGKYGRPHYHLILFVYDRKHTDIEWKGLVENNIIKITGILQDDWSYGIVKTGSVTTDSINYVVEYVDKKIMRYNGVALNNRKPPFRVMSNGIGEKYMADNAEMLKADMSIRIRDKEYGLPRFYKKKLGIDPALLQKKSKSMELVELKKYMKRKRIKKMNVNEWKVYYEICRKQRSVNSEARHNLYRKDRLF